MRTSKKEGYVVNKKKRALGRAMRDPQPGSGLAPERKGPGFSAELSRGM